MSIHDEGAVDLLPVDTVHAFPVNYFVENIAVRESGQVLVTVHNTGELIQVDPGSHKYPPSVVHRFAAGVCGIVEVDNDVFYISSGTIGEKGSFAIFKVDMAPYAIEESSGEVKTPAHVSKLVDIPDALFLNGSALLNRAKGLILAADSLLGAVFCIDVKAVSQRMWLQEKALEKVEEGPTPGVNGIKVYGNYLYLSNTDTKMFWRVGISESNEATEGLEIVAEKCNIDDFAFDNEGSAYLTSHVFQSVFKLKQDGTRSRIAGGPDDTVVAGTTAAAFGRTAGDVHVLYVTTNGGMSFPVNGNVGPGRLLRMKVGSVGYQM